MLEQISYREVVRYLVSADLNEIMSVRRDEAAQIIHDRIQAEADRHNLGASIIFVGLQDIHPPVKVAPDYERFVSVNHTTNAEIRGAEAEAITALTIARIENARIISVANSDLQSTVTNAVARAESFTNQMPAFLASPSVYMQRGYLETFAQSVANTRTYILLATNTHNVAILNLEDKVRPDLLDQISLPAPPSVPK